MLPLAGDHVLGQRSVDDALRRLAIVKRTQDEVPHAHRPHPGPVDEARGDERGVGGRARAEEIAGRRHQPAERQRAAAAGPIGDLAGRDGDEKAGQPVDGDGQADRRLADVERAR
jgi:hypothetical protein